MSQFGWIFEEARLAVNALIEKFAAEPFFFYSEQDMHAYLYHKLISRRLGKFLNSMSFGDKTVLVHREYPTLAVYPSRSGGGKRGRFDLAILHPAHIEESHWRMQFKKPPYSRHRPIVAFEFGLNTIETERLTHFRKDLERLTNPTNMVERGFLLFFVRREDYLPASGLLRVIGKMPETLQNEFNRERPQNVVIVYAETDAKSPNRLRLEIIPEDKKSWLHDKIY